MVDTKIGGFAFVIIPTNHKILETSFMPDIAPETIPYKEHVRNQVIKNSHRDIEKLIMKEVPYLTETKAGTILAEKNAKSYCIKSNNHNKFLDPRVLELEECGQMFNYVVVLPPEIISSFIPMCLCGFQRNRFFKGFSQKMILHLEFKFFSKFV